MNTPSGAFNMKDLEPVENPRCLKSTLVRWNPDARAPNWLASLKEQLKTDEMVEYFLRLMYVSCLGESSEKLFVLLMGKPDCGKTTQCELIGKILGSYAANIRPEFWYNDYNRSLAVEEASFFGVRFVWSAELSKDKRLDVGKLKRFAGNDTIKGEKKHRDPFEFTPSHTIWFSCNEPPAADPGDDAFWNRPKVMPFMHPIENPDKRYVANSIEEEGEGILAEIMRAGQRYWAEKQKIEEPNEVKKATASYRSDNATFEEFNERNLLIDCDSSASVTLTWVAYVQVYGKSPRRLGEREFSRRMQELYRRDHKSDGNYYMGVRLK
jgi:P4 family phage/plasmid primase-like protien